MGDDTAATGAGSGTAGSGELYIVPAHGDGTGDGYVELARTKQGRLFRKHILNKGPLLHPVTGDEITIDDTFVSTLTKNFKDGVCDIVQVPLANEKNEHSEDPARNIGEVIGIEARDDKVYALIDARDDGAAGKLGKTLLGASAMLHMNYTDTKTGKKVGPTLLHTCVTNRPYVTGLEDYEEIVAATSDTSQRAVLLTPAPAPAGTAQQTVPAGEPTAEPSAEPNAAKETDDMGEAPNTTETPAKLSLEEMLTALKTDHNIDVSALQAKAAEGEQAASLSQALTKALTDSGVVKLTAAETTPSTEDVVGAVAELAGNNVKLTDRVNKLERADAEKTVDALVKSGHVMPKQRNAMVELKLTNPAMYEDLVPAEPLLKLTAEAGVTPPQDSAHTKDIDAEVARLSALLAPVTKQ